MRRSLLAVTVLLLAAYASAGVVHVRPANARERLHAALAALQDRAYAKAEGLALQAAQDDQAPQPSGWIVAAIACRRAERPHQARDALQAFLAVEPGSNLHPWVLNELRDLTREIRAESTPSLDEQLSPLEKDVFAVVEVQRSTHRSEHFAVHGHNTDFNRFLAEYAETTLTELKEDLLPGSESLAVAADIYIWPDEESFREHAALPFAEGTSHPAETPRIDLLQRDEDGKLRLSTLTDVLPHELAHLLLEAFLADAPAGVARPDVPLAIKEGFATLAEKSPQHDRAALAGTAAAAQRHIPLEKLLDIATYDDVDHLPLFYAQSHSFVDFLRTKLTRMQFARFFQEIRRGQNVNQALQRTLVTPQDSDFARKLEAAWRDHAILQAQIVETLGHNADATESVARNQ
jgi:hypothetical protein